MTTASAPAEKRVRRQIWMAAEVRTPRRVDDEGDAGTTGHLSDRGDVRAGPDVGRAGHQYPARLGVSAQGIGDGCRPEPERKPGRVVDGRVHPHRPQSRQHQPEHDRAVRRPVHDHRVPRGADRERQAWLPWVEPPTEYRHQSAPNRSAVRASARRTSASASRTAASPPYSGTSPGDDLADQADVVLVPGDRERPELALIEPAPSVDPGRQQRGVLEPVAVHAVISPGRRRRP